MRGRVSLSVFVLAESALAASRSYLERRLNLVRLSDHKFEVGVQCRELIVVVDDERSENNRTAGVVQVRH